MSVTLPNTSIFRFYEGLERDQFMDATGPNLNAAPDQLLANDVALAQAIETLESAVAGVTPALALEAESARSFGGLPSTSYLQKTQKASDSDKLDGLDSTQFVRSDGRGGSRLTSNGLSLADNGTTQFTGMWFDPTVDTIHIQTKAPPKSTGNAIIQASKYKEGSDFLSDKYLGKLDTARDADKLGGTAANLFLKRTESASNSLSLDNRSPTYYSNMSVSDVNQDPNLAFHPTILTKHSNCPGGSVQFWHIITTFFSSISSGSNRSQIAISYDGIHASYTRHYYAGVWTNWAITSGSDLKRTTLSNDTGYMIDQKSAIIWQWLKTPIVNDDTSQTIPFPIMFPNNCFHISVTPQRSSTARYGEGVIATSDPTLSKSTFNIYNGQDTNLYFNVLAMGY